MFPATTTNKSKQHYVPTRKEVKEIRQQDKTGQDRKGRQEDQIGSEEIEERQKEKRNRRKRERRRIVKFTTHALRIVLRRTTKDRAKTIFCVSSVLPLSSIQSVRL